MAFLIPDNLRSRSGVPGGVRRVASAFKIGLGESVTVWYEPLYDPKGEKPHFVVLLPDQGIVVLEVLEVKHGGLLGVLRGRLRFERDGREIEVENPLIRAERLAGILRKRIDVEPRLAGIEVPVGAGAVLGQMSRDQAQDKGVDRVLSLDCCLFRPDLEAAVRGEGETDLLRAFARMLGRRVGEIPQDKEKVLRGLIQPETVIDRVAPVESNVQLTIFRPPEGEEDIIRVMDRQQEQIAKTLGDGHRVIRGVAGSGKTLILVYRAQLLARMLPAHQRILVTCYTRSLAGQLRFLLKEHNNIEVVHLDRLMAKTMRDAGFKHPGYEDGQEAVARMALDVLQRGYGPRYRAVLLDEAQDFGTNALRFAVNLLDGGYEDLVIVADAAQNIFRRRFNWKDAGIQAQGRTKILRCNYRNTREILEFASRFLLASPVLRLDDAPGEEDENAVIPPESAARNGPPPELGVVPDIRAEVAEAVARVKSWVQSSTQPRQVAVLYPASGYGAAERAKSLYEGLRRASLEVFWLRQGDAKDRLAEATEPVILSTIHSAKGLEFPYVVLCGIWREDTDVEANRMLAYVGMTRAMHQLAVITQEDNPLVEDLRKASA